MKRPGDIDDLRCHVGDEGNGYQIHAASSTESQVLAPEEIEICDRLVAFLLTLTTRDIEILSALRRNGYHLRKAARELGYSLSAIQRTIAKLPLTRKRVIPDAPEGLESAPDGS